MPSRRRGRDRARTFFAKRGNCSGVDQGSGAGSDSGEVSSTFGATFWSSPTSTRPRLGEPHSASWAVKYRSEEHTSELQSLMRTSYAVFRLKKKNISQTSNTTYTSPYKHRI